MAILQILGVMITAWLVSGQRPSFAGSKPIGFPELINKNTGDLGNRFGDGTTEQLPVEAKGDRDLIDRISKLPIDNQPFWYINWKALEANRRNPQTYPQKPNVFIGENEGQNTGSISSNTGADTAGLNSKFGTNDGLKKQDNRQISQSSHGGYRSY